ADEGAATAMDSAGNVWIAGTLTNEAKNTDIYVAKYAAADGSLLWEKTFRGADGATDTGHDGIGGYQQASPYQGGDFRRGAIALTPDGGVVITGYITKSDKKMDAVTVKYDASGNLAWSGTFNGTLGGSDYGQSVAVDASGNVFVSGASVNSTIDAMILKYDGATGVRVWDKTYDGGKPDAAVAIKIDSEGNPVISGYSQQATFDFMTARYASADGSLIWMDLLDGPASSSDMAWDFALTDGKRPIVTGTSYPQNGIYDGYTFTYNCPCSTDPVAWAQRYEGPAGKLDQFLSIGTDMFGNPVVTGYSQNANGTLDTQTIKYAAADGSILWQKRYNGPADSNDVPRQILVDPAGNIFISGYTTTSGGATGSWVTRYVATEPASVTAQVITFLQPPPQGVADTLTLTATASSGLPVQYEVVSGPAEVSGNAVTFTGTGSVTLRASQPGDGTYDAATPVERTFSVGISRQVIVFTLPATATADTPIELNGMASSGLPITYTIVSGPATLDGETLVFTGAGTVVVRASQAGNSLFTAAQSVEQTITATKGSQSIAFTLPTTALATDTIPLSGSISSREEITYTVVSGPGVITGSTLSFTGAGAVSVRAAQSGSSVFDAATSVTRTVTVKKAPQTITFTLGSTANITQTATVAATASSGLPVTYSVGGPAVLSGSTLSFTGPGTVTVRANQAGNAVYNAAPVVTKVMTVVLLKPVLADLTLPEVYVG
ncbi:MAG TPA: hypothetical protein VD994_00675, partial [Prosthecobacter sp.]|nr:hypothetical protein [Prosthecobacter sp.]